jgi:hypothetical protein
MLRKLLHLFIRVVCTAGWLSIASCAAHAQAYRVATAEPWLDSVLVAGLDTAHVEHAWCAEATIDRDAHTLTLTMVIDATNQMAYERDVHFTCPRGAIIVHSHLDASYGHGPSTDDKRVWMHLPVQPPAGIIVYRVAPGQHEYLVYGVR